MDDLIRKVDDLPGLPGVYIFKDESGKVIYVGKAKSLKHRVRSYFNDLDTRPQVRFLRLKIKDLETVITDTEKEALILENHLIKKHQPRYNFKLRDDKTFYHLRLTASEKFPRLLLTRRPKKSKDLIFGPFASSAAVKETIRLLQILFPLRRCTSRKFQRRERACINFEIGKCPGPCAGKISEDDYQKSVDQVLKFLRGQGKELISEMEKEMNSASENMEFEKAARLRDQVIAIRETLEKQNVEFNAAVDRDVIGFFRKADRAAIFRLGFRKGILIIGHPYLIKKAHMDDCETLGAFLKQFYPEQSFIPREILLPFPAEDQGLVQEWLEDQAKRKVEIAVPERGDKRAQVELANTNAEQALESSAVKEKLSQDALDQLKKMLHLCKTPFWIECYDISNFGEKLAVGSMVKFLNGEPEKSGYRRFRIKGIQAQNDFEMMRQILSRRFRRALDEHQQLPDLIILDGGKGQLNIALKVLSEMKIKDVELAALAKEREMGGALSAALIKKPERVFLPGRKNPAPVRSEPAKHLLVRVRDEAHRFAVEYLRKLRGKAASRSVLEEIPGIGERKKRFLLRHFGSVKKIEKASLEELKACPGISGAEADQVFNFFRNSALLKK